MGDRAVISYGAVKRRIRKALSPSVQVTPPGDAPRESFAQCGEDLVVAYLFDALGIDKGFYLDIGANHPSQSNNTLFFYKRGWRGVNIDPLAENIDLFRIARPDDLNIHAGIGEDSGSKDFYRIHPETLSTFNRQAAEGYSAQGHAIKSVTRIDVLSASDLVVRHGIPTDPDLLSIDVEGDELAIIAGLIAAGVRPKVIICETVFYARTMKESRKNERIITAIREFGYAVYADTYVNTVFVDPGVISGERPMRAGARGLGV
jgi:FkbM family methyltransferase